MNYLLVALYNLWRQPVFSAVKVLSLAIGLGCSILVIMHVQYVLSYDRHIPGWQNIYRVVTSLTLDYRIDTELTNDAAPHQMRLDYPEIEHLAMISSGTYRFTRNGVSTVTDFLVADGEFLAIFTPDFIAGDATSALNEPFAAVVDASTARKLFGDEAALGQILTLFEQDLKVTGVIRDLPKNTHLQVPMLISTSTFREVGGEDFMNNNAWNDFSGTRTYIRVPDKATADAIAADLPAFMERNLPDDQKDYAVRTNQQLYLEPLADIYLSPRQDSGQGRNNRGRIITALALFAGLILLTSCINFVNLSYSQMRARGKEIGVRKTVGAKQRDIVLQFLLESLLLTLCALCLALPLVWLAVPAYTALTGTDFTFADAANGRSVATLVAFVIATGLLSGLFPALSIARHDPAEVIKGAASGGRFSRLARPGVTVLQFGLSTALILLAVAITLQIRHLNTMDVGFNKDDLVVLPAVAANNYTAMANDLLQHPAIAAVAGADTAPPGTGSLDPWRLSSWTPERYRSVQHIMVDENYLDVMQLRLLAGRWFAADFTADFSPLRPSRQPLPATLPAPRGVVITRTAALSFGLGAPADALGVEFVFGPDNYRVIGVVEDFRMTGGMEDPLSSIMIIRASQGTIWNTFLVRIDSAQTDAALAHIDAVWQRYQPDAAFDRTFFRQTYNDLIDTETRGINIAAIFASIVSIAIAAFGLYALAVHATQRRTKEVGIRKVLGATSKKVVRLLTWDFLKPVLLACVLASMGGYYAIQYYLQQFAARVEISPLLYLGVIAGTLLIAALTVAVQCRRAARADPVRSLRYE